MRLNRTQIESLILLGLAILILIQIPVYLFWIRPEMDVDNKASQRLEKIQAEVAHRQQVVQVLRTFDFRLNESRKNFQTFASTHLFPSDRAGSQLLHDLEQISLEAGLIRNRVSYRFDDKSLYGLQRIDFSIPVEGSYPSIRRFLNILEKGSHFILIDSIAMESDREGQGGEFAWS